MGKTKGFTVSSYRWVVLAVFMFVALLSQLLWLTFAPISSEVSGFFGVNAFDVSLLSLVWPLVFVVSSIPAGVFIDKKGFKKSVSVGAGIMAVFSVLRVFSVAPNHDFTLLLLSQTGAAFSQAFVFGSITKLTISWFPEDEQGLATGLGTIGLFLGMMIALVLTPMIFLSYGLYGVVVAYAVVSCIGAVLFLVFAKERKTVHVEETASAFTLKDLWRLSRVRDFLILEYGFFAGVGGFTAIMTWLEEILKSMYGLSVDKAGFAGGLMIIGGVVGSIAVPAFSDRLNKIKAFVLLDLAVGAIMVYLIGFVDGFVYIAVICFVAGFFLMSALPLVLEIGSRIAGPGMEGRASSMLWFFSQLGAMVLIAVVEPVKSLCGSYYYSLVLIATLWMFAFFLFIGVNEINSSDKTH
ncbi:MAG TPA: MFS transporter [Thermoplasmatales archaeon]|nr:MFS transporter [Thermoplasmatales archaeon]